MNNEEVAQRVEVLREKLPQKFVHPELRPNEIWLGNILVDIVDFEVETLQGRGVPSARTGNKPVLVRHKGGIELHHYPVFADVSEVIKAGIIKEEYTTRNPEQTAVST